MSQGNNGQSYEENWKRHQQLLDNAAAIHHRLQQSCAMRDAAKAEFEAQRNTLTEEEVRARSNEVYELEYRSDLIAQQLAEARTAVAALELQAGPQQGGWLAEGQPPGLTDRQRQERHQAWLENLAKVKDAADEAARFSLIVAQLSSPHAVAPADRLAEVRVQSAIERPVHGHAEPSDIGELVEKTHRPKTRQDIQKSVDDARQGARAYDQALADAPSRPADEDPYLAQRRRLEREAKEQEDKERGADDGRER